MFKCYSSWTFLAVIVLCGPLLSAYAAEKTLWEIGKADNDTAEFAYAPNHYDQYDSSRGEPVFLVGQSDPGTDWPYVHPGPSDAWAGGKLHTFTIYFGLDRVVSDGECSLVVDLADTHAGSPPKLRIDVNGHSYEHSTPRGASDESIRGNASAGKEHRFTVVFPAAELKQGNNAIAITAIAGSWMLYDALALETPSGMSLGGLTAETMVDSVSTRGVLFERQGEKYQPVDVHIQHIGDPIDATLAVGGGDPVPVQIVQGQQSIEYETPAVEKETNVAVKLESNGAVLADREVVVQPVREWVVYLLHHTHLDIGYTHVQTEVEARQWEFIDQAIDLAKKTADYPAGAQFKWSPEGLWAVDSYLAKADADTRERFVAAVKKGWIGLDALYGNELTALCRPEELLRTDRMRAASRSAV